jgi:hypothetical protein
VQAAIKTDPGAVEFYDAYGNHLKSVAAGALPDMVTFTPKRPFAIVDPPARFRPRDRGAPD